MKPNRYYYPLLFVRFYVSHIIKSSTSEQIDKEVLAYKHKEFMNLVIYNLFDGGAR